jgi:hypothetical protein
MLHLEALMAITISYRLNFNLFYCIKSDSSDVVTHVRSQQQMAVDGSTGSENFLYLPLSILYASVFRFKYSCYSERLLGKLGRL